MDALSFVVATRFEVHFEPSAGTCTCASEVTDGSPPSESRSGAHAEPSSDRVPTLPLAWSVLVDAGRARFLFEPRESDICAEPTVVRGADVPNET